MGGRSEEVLEAFLLRCEGIPEIKAMKLDCLDKLGFEALPWPRDGRHYTLTEAELHRDINGSFNQHLVTPNDFVSRSEQVKDSAENINIYMILMWVITTSTSTNICTLAGLSSQHCTWKTSLL